MVRSTLEAELAQQRQVLTEERGASADAARKAKHDMDEIKRDIAEKVSNTE